MPLVDDIELLILYASIGSGHKTAAEAIAEQTAVLGGERLRVRLVDLLDLTDLAMTDRLSAVPATGGIGGLYDVVWGASWLSAPVGATLRGMRRFAFPRLRAQVTPATRAVVSTHALGAILTADLLQAWRVAVLTDFLPHGYWPRHVDRVCVPTNDAVRELESRGFPAAAVALTGIPVREQFARPPGASEARARLGVDSSARVALVVAGARDAGPYARLAARIPAVVSALLEAGVTPLVLTGTDVALAQSVSAAFGEQARVIPYTDDMATPIAAADVVIAKPGGSILAEVIACGRPLVLLARGNGQERANSTYLEQAGAALIAETDESLRGALAIVARGHDSLRVAGGLAHPQAASEVARIALEPFLEPPG